MARQVDFSVSNHGTMFMVFAHTPSAESWVEQNVSQEGYQPYFPKAVVGEPRYLADLWYGIKEAGFKVT